MEDLKKIVVTKYGDYQGNVSMDMQDQFICQLKSFDLPEGVVIGAGFEFDEIIGKESFQSVVCYVLVADPEYGTNMQEVIDNAPSENLKVTKVKKTSPVNELGLFFKRFNCCGIYKGLKNEQNFDVQ